MEDKQHWAYGAYENLIKLGIKINETRFDEPMTRGEVFAVLNNVLTEALKMSKNTPSTDTVQKPVVDKKVEYFESSAGTKLLKGNIDLLNCVVYNKGCSNIAIQEKNCVNGTFFTWDAGKNYFSTSPLVVNGKAYRWESNHKKPQSCFIIYKNNTVEMRRINNISELQLDQVKFLFGGVGLFNHFDPNFKYDPASEGFSGMFSDVLRATNKTVIGYKKDENKIYLLTRNIVHQSDGYDLIDVCNDYKLDIALSLDGGGSTFLNYEGQSKRTGDGRRVHNVICFNV